MLHFELLKILITICVIKFSFAAVLRPPPSSLIPDEAKDNFEKQMRLETEDFLNNIFDNQIGFFNKVKTSLQPDSQRYHEIEAFVEKLRQAKQEKSLDKKDELYYDSLKKMDKSSFFLNERTETGLSDNEYQKILEENGLKELMKNFLADATVYFWKMAKHSGKVVETTVDRFIDNMQKDKTRFLS